jgi:hypothetical protein
VSNLLAVVIDNDLVVKYDRNVSLPEHQRESLDRMDLKLDAGIELLGEIIEQPDPRQRATFVAQQLIGAILSHDDSLTAACAAYLAERYPDLKQVRVQFEGESHTVELVFDRPYAEQTGTYYVAPPRKGD